MTRWRAQSHREGWARHSRRVPAGSWNRSHSPADVLPGKDRLAALRYDDGSRQVRRRSRRRSSCPTAGWMRPPRGCSGCCRSTRTGRWTRTAFNGVRWADADAGNILAGTATDLVLNQETWADPPRRPLRRARDPRPPVRHGHHGPSRREL